MFWRQKPRVFLRVNSLIQTQRFSGDSRMRSEFRGTTLSRQPRSGIKLALKNSGARATRKIFIKKHIKGSIASGVRNLRRKKIWWGESVRSIQARPSKKSRRKIIFFVFPHTAKN